MSRLPFFVGLDYHSESVQVCVMDANGRVLVNRRCRNELAVIVDAVPAGSRVQAAIEACNGSANLADDLVLKAGWSVDLAHPGYVARIKQSPDKTDFSDAQLLADLERVGYLPRVWLAPKQIRELRRLVRFRQQLVANRRSTKLRIRSLLRDHRLKQTTSNAWTLAWLAWVATTPELPEQSRWIMDQHLLDLRRFNEQIAMVEQRLKETVKDDPVVAKLMSIPGCGIITAVTLRAEIGQFDRFRTGKQLARFCGLSPRNASSGKKQADAGVIKAGNPELRRVITQAAQRLVRYDQHWSDMACRLKSNGKRKCVIIAAVANRWIRRMFHQMKEVQMAA